MGLFAAPIWLRVKRKEVLGAERVSFVEVRDFNYCRGLGKIAVDVALGAAPPQSR